MVGRIQIPPVTRLKCEVNPVFSFKKWDFVSYKPLFQHLMFACSRAVDRATTNDDNPIPGPVLAEALNLCCKDAANIPRIVKSCSQKLTNSFVTVRIKALQLLLHCSQLGPPAVVLEVRQYCPVLNDCLSWRGEPHPTRGFQAYDEMKSLCQNLLDIAYGNAPRAPKQAAQPKFQFHQPAPQPQQPMSIMTPYEEQLAAQQTQQTSYNQQFGSQQFQSRQGTYGATSNVAPSQDKGGLVMARRTTRHMETPLITIPGIRGRLLQRRGRTWLRQRSQTTTVRGRRRPGGSQGCRWRSRSAWLVACLRQRS